jgi:hypothetical protein
MQQHAVLNNGRTQPYALGLFVDTYRGLRRVRHGGSWAGYRAELMRFPDQHLSVAVQCNLARTNPTALATRVAEVFLGSALAAAGESPSPGPAAPAGPVTLAAREVDRYAGLYRSPKTGELRRIFARHDSLLVSDLATALPLEPLGADRFRVPGAQPGPELQLDRANPSRQLTLIAPSGDTVAFERIAAAAPSARDLEAYAGRYWSEEVGAEYRLLVQDGALVLTRRRSEPIVLEPTYADAFAAGGVLYRFGRRDGRVTEMLVDAGRIRNLRFVRRAN